MTSDLEQLKKEANELAAISDSERKEILSDLRMLEGDNKKRAELELEELCLKYRKDKETVIAICLLCAAIIIFSIYKYL